MPTAWTYIRNIRLFLRRAQAEGESAKAETKLPKLGKPLVEILEVDEIQRLEDAADSERDKLIIRVLADGGIRVGELVKLRLPDLTQHERSDYLRCGARAGERLVPLGPTLARRLRRYQEHQRPPDARTDRLFVARRRAARSGDYEP